MAGLPTLNALSPEAAIAALSRCCGSRRWAQAMCDLRPFKDAADLMMVARRVWDGLAPADWLEAFSHHPRIGGKDALRKRFAATQSWSTAEQSKTAAASEKTLEALARANEEYERRFGRVFIICASGKSAEEMLKVLKARLINPPHRELKAAAAEQARITELRLAKLLAEL